MSKSASGNKITGGKPGPGRPKGSPNKTTALLKDAILKAAELAGGEATDDSPGGLTAYLQAQALANPGPFMSLLGKVLPTQLTGEGGGPIATDNAHHGAVSVSDTAAFIAESVGARAEVAPGKPRTH
jgi:hypothetical protein